MQVLITGGSGFIARRLIPAALDAGLQVRTLDRRPAPPDVSSAVDHIRADLTSGDRHVVAALRSADAVIHLAACPGVRDTRPDVEERRRRDNVAATEVVASCTPADVPLIAFSSSSVYGDALAHFGRTRIRGSRETDVLAPKGGYAASKVAAEEICTARAVRGGATLVVRPFTVLGEGQRHDMAVAAWAESARRGDPLVIYGSPTRRRDVTDVRDVASATLALLRRGAHGVVNLGTGRSRTLTEIAAATCRAVGAPLRMVVVDAAAVEVTHTRADTTRLRQWIGTVPRTDLDDVVRRAVNVPERTSSCDARLSA